MRVGASQISVTHARRARTAIPRRSSCAALPHARARALTAAQLEALNDWLKHYRPQELFDGETGAPVKGVLSVVPEREEKRMGMRRETYDAYRPLKTPEWMGMGVGGDEG